LELWKEYLLKRIDDISEDCEHNLKIEISNYIFRFIVKNYLWKLVYLRLLRTKII